MVAKKNDFARAATQKGFREKRKGHHIYYQYVTPEGKLCPQIQTYISHGSKKDISDSLLSTMTHQMKFNKKADLIEFIACTFSKEKYFDLLKKKRLI